jgi:2-alkyl-3-oxoalkanoate reductase
LKVLVTGGSGFLGSHVVEQLVTDGHQVRALVRKSSDTQFLKDLKVELAYGAVEDADSVREAMQGVEGAIHAAGLVKARSPEEFERINVGGTKNMLDAAREESKFRRFVMVSSLAAVGPSHDGKPIQGNDGPGPVTHYGRSKLKAEAMVRESAADLSVVILRPPMIYGPRDRESLAFFKSVKTGVLPYLGDGRNTLSVIYGPDCARACIRALAAKVQSGSTYFVEDGNVYVWKDMLGEIEKALEKKAFMRFSIPFNVVRAVALGNEFVSKLTNKPVMLTRDKVNELAQPHWVCDGARAVKELGWTPKVGWAEGVRQSANWYRQAGWL